jgi:hypothetical protein
VEEFFHKGQHALFCEAGKNTMPVNLFPLNFAAMKPIRALIALFSIALLAFANWVTPALSAVHTVPTKEGIQHTWLAAAPGADLPDGINEQRYASGTGQGSGTSTKQIFSWAFLRPVFLNAPCVSGIHYYLLSRFIRLGFPTTDVIFPFHQFW